MPVFNSPVDLAKNELRNARVQNLASAPSSPVAGQIYYDTGTNKLFWWNGSSWIDATGGAGGISSSIVDAKGDLIVGTADNTVARKAVGANDTFLVGASGQADGLQWRTIADTDLPGTITRDSEVFLLSAYTTKGDIGIATGSGAVSRHGVGANGTFLVANSAQGDGWQNRAIQASDIQELLATSDLTDWPRTAPLDLNSQRLTSVSDPSAAQDAATKAYVDAQVAGARDVKESVRVATNAALPAYTRTANVITATANGALAAVDGVTLVLNDRLLLKNGAAGADNGIYTVTVVGTGGTPYQLTRATDADSNAEVTAGMYTWVTEGTANADSGWLLTTDDPITLNTTSLTFTQISGLGQITAGGGMTKTGNQLDVIAGTGMVVNADDVAVDVSVVARYKKFTIGDGSSTTINCAHNLNNTSAALVALILVSTGKAEMVDWTIVDANTIAVGPFLTAPASNAYRVLIVG